LGVVTAAGVLFLWHFAVQILRLAAADSDDSQVTDPYEAQGYMYYLLGDRILGCSQTNERMRRLSQEFVGDVLDWLK